MCRETSSQIRKSRNSLRLKVYSVMITTQQTCCPGMGWTSLPLPNPQHLSLWQLSSQSTTMDHHPIANHLLTGHQRANTSQWQLSTQMSLHPARKSLQVPTIRTTCPIMRVQQCWILTAPNIKTTSLTLLSTISSLKISQPHSQSSSPSHTSPTLNPKPILWLTSLWSNLRLPKWQPPTRTPRHPITT